jgi:hypothetical protein
MIRIALFTALAMAASTAVYAGPDRAPDRDRDRDRDRDYRVDYDRDAPIVYQRDRDHYDRYDDSYWSREYRGRRWTPLARAFDTRSERQFIALRGDRYRKVRVEGVRGAPMITKVVIEFLDRSTQVVELNSTLPGGAGEVIDLNGGTRRINRIIVYTDPRTRGAYSVYGT